MTPQSAVLAVVEALDAHAIAYMITGSFASNLYGIPRSTQDADFVVEFGGADVRALLTVLSATFIVARRCPSRRLLARTVTGSSRATRRSTWSCSY